MPSTITTVLDAVPVSVVVSAKGRTNLPRTGSDVDVLIIAAALLIVVGALLVRLARAVHPEPKVNPHA